VNADTDFEYAQARLLARYGDRPSDDTWGQLRSTRTAAQLLTVARRSGLGRWVAGLDERQDVGDSDRAIRRAFFRHALEVADWVPERWSLSVAWTTWLPELSAFDAVLRSGVERVLGAHGFVEPGDNPLVERCSDLIARELRPLATGELAPAMRARWSARFRRLWPPMDATRRRALEELCALVSNHLGRMGRIGVETDGWGLRAELASDLGRCFRRAPPGPVAVYSYLGLVLLDLERLRGGLVRRLLFPHVEGESAWV
jgi:hypothetical protein